MELNPINPALWLAGSVALAIAGTNGVWLLARHRPRIFAPGPCGEAGAGWSGWPALAWLLAALFLLLPPVAAWRSGALSPYFMGLAELDWLAGLGAGGPLLVTVIALVLFGWLVHRRVLRAEPGLVPAAASAAAEDAPAWRAPVEAALAQWHWAFYRSVVIAWLASGTGAPLTWLHQIAPAINVAEALTEKPIYWGTWIGLLLVAFEWVLNPFGRAGLHLAPLSPDDSSPAAVFGAGRQQEATLRGMALALATGALFTLTRNFWLCLACHVIIEAAIAGPVRLSLKATKDG